MTIKKTLFPSLLIGITLSYLGSQYFPNKIAIAAIMIATTLCAIYFLLKSRIKEKSSNILFITTFILIITFPLIGKKETITLEKRALAEYPKFNIEFIWGYFFDFTKYFNDRLSHKNTTVETINKFKMNTLKISPLAQKVELGKNQWLYSAGEEYYQQASATFSESELEQIEFNLEAITTWFQLKGMKYYLLITPVKIRIYPEYSTSFLVQKQRNSKLEQIYTRISTNTNIQTIDCRKTLIEGKKIRPTYFKTDTHWNKFGGFLAYLEIMKKINFDFPTLAYYTESDFKLDSNESNGGDLQQLFGLTNEIKFTNYTYNPINQPNPINITVDFNEKLDPKNKEINFITPNPKNSESIYVVRDSFTEYLRIYITQNFSRSSYFWAPKLPISRIIEQKPNIILHEMLEIFTSNLLELPQEIQQDTVFLNKQIRKHEDKKPKI